MCNYIIKSGWKKSFSFCGKLASPEPVSVLMVKWFLHWRHCHTNPMITAPVSILNCLLWHDGQVAQVSVFEIISLLYMAFLCLGNWKGGFFLVSIFWQATKKMNYRSLRPRTQPAALGAQAIGSVKNNLAWKNAVSAFILCPWVLPLVLSLSEMMQTSCIYIVVLYCCTSWHIIRTS